MPSVFKVQIKRSEGIINNASIQLKMGGGKSQDEILSEMISSDKATCIANLLIRLSSYLLSQFKKFKGVNYERKFMLML